MNFTIRRALSALTLAGLVGVAGCGKAVGPVGEAAIAGGAAAMGAPGKGALSLLVMPDMGVQPLLQAIKGARKSIQLEVYMLTNHDESAQIVQALADRAKAGVKVQVILEARPYIPPSGADCAPPKENPNLDAIRVLQAGGVEVQYGSPRFRFTHEKSMVIDGATAYIMTMNLTNSAFNSNRDFAVVDRNPADVAEVARIFQADWQAKPYTPKNPNLVVSPDNSRAKLLKLIDSATKSLIIETEFLSDPEMASHLKARVQAGVDITVMLSYQEKNPCMPGDINADATKLMHEIGVTKFVLSQKVRMHAKIMVADGARAYVGSENLTANSLDNNREVGILIQDPAIVAQLSQIALKDYSQH
jgi:phosphatidylserine/phosphatidylglycerophosphate/cardiolipin synthase-like enzyme